MVNLAERKFIVCQGFPEDEAGKLFNGTVVDVGASGSVTAAAIHLISLKIEKECAQLPEIRFLYGNRILVCKPAATLKDTLKVAVNRSRPVINELQDLCQRL